ncbi:MAG: hypothetical protein HQ567_34835, partial [Candidatus Nealsonbacteria bacterium]|nr:hypothetical protein [Candidatus Nealsonbacteria bacterium]
VLAMPAARDYWQRVDEDGDGYSETRRRVREDELILFTVDVTATRLSGDGIELLGELLHDSPVRRSAFIEDVLYSVAENSAQAVSIADPTVRFAEITFDGGPPPETPGGQPRVQIMDDRDEDFHTEGYWSPQADQGYADGMHFIETGSGDDVASWSFWVEPGYYRVAATWSAYANRASNAPFTVLDGSTPLDTVRLNQESAPDDFVEGQTAWENVGTFPITGNRLVVTLSGDADEYVVADAIRIESVPMISGRGVFYNNSAFDDPDLAATDDDAIAPDKEALLPGKVATFENYTSYSRGINGVFVDIAGLPGGATPTADDFEFRIGNDDAPGGWTAVAAEPTITLREGAGADYSDRVTIVFPDHAVRNTWLEVRVLAENLGLPDDDVFYFGNAVAEAGDTGANAQTTVADLLLARNNPRDFRSPAGVDSSYDYNRDTYVNATDVLLARNNRTSFLDALNLIDLSGVAEEAQGTPLAELAWLTDLDQPATQRPAQKDAVAGAVDLLLATLWS